MSYLLYMQHRRAIIDMLPGFYIIRYIFVRVIPHIPTRIQTAYFNILTQFECKHLVATSVGSIIHHAVGSDDISITGNASGPHYLHILYTFTEKHGIMKEC